MKKHPYILFILVLQGIVEGCPSSKTSMVDIYLFGQNVFNDLSMIVDAGIDERRPSLMISFVDVEWVSIDELFYAI